MTIEYGEDRAVLQGLVTVEDAEPLLEWLQTHRNKPLDLSACTHVHAASLQVLMTMRAPISAWPDTPDLRAWLEAAQIPLPGA